MKGSLSRLCNAIQRSRFALRRPRENRVALVRQLVGSNYSEDGADRRVPLNLISLYTSIVGRNLISKNPRVMLSTFERDQKPMVHAMETWANEELERMKFANTMKRVVLDALFSVGIAKVCLSSPSDASLLGWRLSAGHPIIGRVDLDDFVFDVHARDLTEVGFIGHRFRVPIETVKDSSLFNKRRKDLMASRDQPYNLEGDEKVSMIGRTYYDVDGEEFEDMIDLWEIYLPRQRMIVTLPDDAMGGTSQMIIREQDWIGPDCGPYHALAFQTVPGNPLGKGPLQDLIEMHNSANKIYRKLDMQAWRQKQVLPIRTGATEDGSRITQANDGEAIRCDNDAPKAVDFGGINQMNFNYGIHIVDQFMKFAGNLEMMGGLAPQSKTLGQDEMLSANASGGIKDMQDQVVQYVSDVVRSMLWYWHHHPQKTMSSEYSVKGTNASITRHVTPQDRKALHFDSIKLEVDPYSMAHRTPQQAAQALDDTVMKVVMPMAQLLQQQGVVFDVNAYLEKKAHYQDMPDLSDIITMQEPPPPEQAQGQGGPAGPSAQPETTRNYVRRSLGGDTPDNRKAAMTNMTGGMMNGEQQ
jgi:hypothetical protein